jgi:cobalamin biosynthesis Mg chelatase CobN
LFRKLSATALVIFIALMVSILGCAGHETTAVTSTPAATITTSTAPATSASNTSTTAATNAASTTATATASGTSTKTGSGAGTGTATPATAAGYGIKVTQNGKTLIFLSLSDIDKLATITISAEGASYTGPTILSILSQAGINDFAKVTIVGFAKGRLATAELPVSKAELNNKYIVRRTNQNTYSLASPDVPSNNWIIDVDELRVE